MAPGASVRDAMTGAHNGRVAGKAFRAANTEMSGQSRRCSCRAGRNVGTLTGERHGEAERQQIGVLRV